MDTSSKQKSLTSKFIDLFCRETPPTPTAVRIDLTPPKADGMLNDSHMSWDFYVRLCREIRRAGVEDLVIAHLGDAFKCLWLQEAITFAKYFCGFPHLVLRADALTPADDQIRSAVYAGLDCLILNFNLASPEWKAAAMRELEKDPKYFSRKLAYATSVRDDLFIESKRRCVIYIARLGCIESGHPLLDEAIRVAAEEADHNAFEELHDLDGVVGLESNRSCSGKRGGLGCHCWTPFTEAHVTAEGFLAACAHDYSGRSNVADLNKVSFTQAWHDPSFQHLRRALLTGDTSGTVCACCTDPDVFSAPEMEVEAG